MSVAEDQLFFHCIPESTKTFEVPSKRWAFDVSVPARVEIWDCKGWNYQCERSDLVLDELRNRKAEEVYFK